MAKCAEIGVKGLKIDFFHTENLFTVRLMEEILKDAAKEKLMVIFHGVNKPAGESFKYPNLLAKEAVRGLECVGGESSWHPDLRGHSIIRFCLLHAGWPVLLIILRLTSELSVRKP